MNTSMMQSITVLASASLEKALLEGLQGWGAELCCVSQSRMGKTSGSNTSELSNEQVRIEALAGKKAAQQIMRGLHDEYSKDTSVVYYVSDVVVNSLTIVNNSDRSTKRDQREARWGDYLITI